jgi:hypothetical protein
MSRVAYVFLGFVSVFLIGQAFPPYLQGQTFGATLDFPSIPNGDESDMTFAGPVAVGDLVKCEATVDLPSHIHVSQAWVATAGVVTTQLMNSSNQAHDPAAVVFKCAVIR